LISATLTAAALAARENRREIAAMETFIVMSNYACVSEAKERDGSDEYQAQSCKAQALIYRMSNDNAVQSRSM
jgi:hypothetical protein